MSNPSTSTKIAYVVNSLNLGGTETLVVQMSQALAGDYDITVLCLDEPGIWASDLRKKDIAVHCLWRQPGMDLRVSFRIASFCKQNRISIIHAHQCTPWFYSALSRLLNPEPRLLFEEHGRFYPEIENRNRAIFNSLLIQPLTHRMVAVSEDVRRRLVRYEGLDSPRIEVVYNGVSPIATLTSEDRSVLRASIGIPQGAFLIGSVGRLDPIKNYPLLIESFSSLIHIHPQIFGIIAGDGPDMDSLRLRINSLGLEDRFILLGYRADARKIIQCLDLFILCSVSEGTSMALLEAMSAGVPVAVTEVGGNPEIVLRGETGWVVPSGDQTGLTAAISEAVSDPATAQQYRSAAQKRYEANFSFHRMLDKYRTLYDRLTCR